MVCIIKEDMGRRSKCTLELTERICQYLRQGVWIEDACALVGIADRSFYNWMARGERAWKIDGRFVQFSQAVKRARAEAAKVSIGRIRQAGQGGTWQADAWFLERSYPQRWGRRYQQHEVSGPGGKPVELKVTWGIPRPTDDRGDAES